MSNRNYIKDSILLCGESDHGKFLRTFFVKDIIDSSGTSAVCYEASYEGSGIGVLKEFYPLEVPSLMRNKEGQLIRKSGAEDENQKYEELLAAYIEPYKLLMNACKHGDMATFIPPFEIYYGCDEDCNVIGTVYIWSPEPKLETFDKVCAEIHENPTVNPEYNLARVLYSIESLVKCVRDLHCAGLVHRDIKPSNFGFVKRGKELLTQTISFFDVDTICSVHNILADDIARGTPGYAEPNIKNKGANNLTDIFAIGATLFHAIIVTDITKTNNYIYDVSFYPEIKNLVDNSELICYSETNSHPHLRHLLTKILRKTLCNRDERYQCCEDLLSDVQQALYYVIPAELSDRGEAGEQWILADLDKIKALDKNYEKNSTLALQYHLYMHPLYQNCPVANDTLDVLIVGFGNYGQKFLDLALQIAQMPEKRLNITVIHSEEEDKTIYLSERPELDKFFNIEGSLSEDPESYGDVRFIKHRLDANGSENDAHFFHDLLDTHPFDYAFVATGRDSQNIAVARTVGAFGSTSFAWEGKRLPKTELQDPLPVYVCEDISSYPFFSELERMALNTHLIWEKNLNINFSKVRKNFRKQYNYKSCVSFVLSMKYKLSAIGIDMALDSLAEVAKKYNAYIATHAESKNALVYYEHRRWVAEKLCLGYTRITDLNTCATGKTKDEIRKQHICIVRSTPDHTLAGSDWVCAGKINKEKWDNPTEEDLQELDELDRMSVELHLVYLEHANMEKESNVLDGNIVAAIMNHIENDAACVIAFQELFTCMKDIWENDSEQWNRYEGLRHVFFENVQHSDVISERNQKTILHLMDTLNEKFYPILASQQYRDYKKDDVALVEGIPFILTYSDSLYMVIPFATGNNTEVFANLAAPTVVNPSKIIYLAYCNNTNDLNEIRKYLPYIASYMKKKEFRASVEFIIGYLSTAKIGNLDTIETDFKVLSNKRIRKVKMMATTSRFDFMSVLKDYLKIRSKNKNNFLLEMNEKVPLEGVMEGAGLYNEYPYYSYDTARMKFTKIHDCEIVTYIRVEPFITVTDMFTFQLTTSTTSNKPEFYSDYRDLWQKYRFYTGAWKYLSGLLKKYAETNDIIASFRRGRTPNTEAVEHQYIVPFKCKKSISRILNALIAEEIIDAQSCINSLTTHSCMAIIKDPYNNKEPYDKLFSRIDILVQTDFIRCDVNTVSHVVKIVYNNLVVCNLDCENLQNNGYDLLNFFEEKGYLIHFISNRDTKKASFTYATPQIKDLLTVEGRMLEIYTYHKAKETGAFDDIRSSFEINWEHGIAKNEFDCILTRGFSTLFVECKATRNINTEFYTKLHSLTEKFGINATAVLVADTQDTDDTKVTNDRQRKIGNGYNVVTISDRADIGNIGNILLKLLKEQ